MGFFRFLFSLVQLSVAVAVVAQPNTLSLSGRSESIPFPPDTVVDASRRVALFLQIDSDLDSLEIDAGTSLLKLEHKTGSALVWLNPDAQTVLVRRNGFLPLEIRLSARGILYETSMAWKLNVVPEDNPVTVNFLIKPEDALFSIDNRKTMRTRSVKLTQGRHRVTVEKPGFKKIDRVIVVEPGTTLYEFSLQPWELQPVTVRSEPEGALFFLDDIEKGITDKALFLYPGRYRIKLVKSGFLDSEQEIVVKDDAPTELTIPLKKNTGLFLWTTEPPGARIMLNREDITTRYAMDLAPGKYQVELTNPGYDSLTDSFEIRLGEETKKTFRLKLQTGTLQINLLPVEASFELIKDGWLVRKGTGTAMLKQLPAGSYTAVVFSTGHTEESRPFTVNRDATHLIDVRLKPATPAPVLQPERVSALLNTRFILVEPGSFSMGADTGAPDEKPVHTVVLTRPFYIGQTEVTRGQWNAVMGISTSAAESDDLPMGSVSYTETLQFIARLNQKEPGAGYRLPTEAEWEFACGPMPSDDAIRDAMVWHSGNSGGVLKAAGSRRANSRDLFDMLGSVWEWTSDWYAESYYTASPTRDPMGPATGSGRVMRGGSVLNPPKNTRSTYRFAANPDFKNFNYGFRLVRQP